ncbi:MAG: PucR family transcriptional regulator [Candidatus Flexifilum sp.]
MPTVAEVLRMQELVGARVVAGAAGIDRPVAWVHVSPVPDAPLWLNGGELVLTTALNLPQSVDGQRTYVRQMADKGVAALALAVGSYIHAAPEHMRAEADACGFPLIEIPYQARFVDIARAVNQRISQTNMAIIERVLHINQTLTRLVLEGGGLPQLARQLAELIGQSVSIENERFESLAVHNVAPVDEARRYTQEQQRTDPRLLAELERRGVFADIRRTLRPVHLPPLPEVGLEFERILAPIIVHAEIYGYMWIIAAERPLSTLDMLAIDSGATIAALMLLYQEAAQNAEASLKGGLLTRLLQGDIGESAAPLTDQALRYGVNLSAPHVLLMLETAALDAVALTRRVNRLAAREGWRIMAGEFVGQCVIVCASGPDPRRDADLTRLIAALAEVVEPKTALRIGVSAAGRGPGHVLTAYAQARDALFIASRLGQPETRIAYFDDLGYLYTLFRAGRAALDANPYIPMLRRLSGEPGADLFRTLEVFVDSGGSGVRTAELLSIHRSTLNYRLERIAAITGVDLTDPDTRINLQVAIKLFRLFAP